MAEKRSAYILNLKGDLEERSRRYSRAIERMSHKGQRDLRGLDRAAGRLGQGFDKLGSRYTALAGAVALGAGTRYFGNLQHRFTRLGIQANQSKEEMAGLRNEIYATAQMSDIRVDPGEITSAVESIVEKTGDLKFAQQNIRNIGLAMQATGADGNAIGELFGEFEKAGITSTDAVMKAIDTLNVQGKEGAFTLENLAALGPRVITAYTASTRGARDGVTTLREMGAALQVIRQGTGSAEQAATAFEGVLRTLSDPAKIKQLQKGGIQIFDPAALKRGEKVMRPINQLMVEIYKRAHGDRTILGQIFDSEGLRAFNALTPENMQKFYDVQADGTATQQDAARAAGDFNNVMRGLVTSAENFANTHLADDFERIAEAIGHIDPDNIERALKAGVGLAGVAAGLYGYRRVRRVAGSVGEVLRRNSANRRGKAQGLAGKMSSLGDVQRVFVVNMGTGGMGGTPGRAGGGRNPGTAGDAGGSKRPRGRSGRGLSTRRGRLGIGRVVRAGGRLGAVGVAAGADLAAAGSAGYGVGTVINNVAIDGTRLGDQIGAAVAHTLAFFGNDDARQAVAQMQRAAETMQRAAEKMDKAESHVRLQIDGGGARITSMSKPAYKGPLRSPDPYAGPLRVGADY